MKKTLTYLTLFLILIYAHTLSSYNFTKNTELRGTWLSIYEHTTTREQAREAILALKNLGINTIYIDVYNNGRVYYKSPTMERLLGVDGRPVRDHLSYCIEEAHKNGMKAIAWFEYGTIAAFSGASDTAFLRYARSRGWLLESGRVAHNYIWLNIEVRDVRLFLIEIMKDCIKGYPKLDGVQLDDHFGWPSLLPNGVPADRRAGLMQGFAIGLVSGLKTALSESGRTLEQVNNFIFSFSPNILPNSEQHYSVKWQDWGTLFDEYIPQTYRPSFSTYRSVCLDQFALARNINRRALAFGIRIVGSGANTPWNDVKEQILWTKQQTPLRGFVLWYARGILETYKTQFQNERIISR